MTDLVLKHRFSITLVSAVAAVAAVALVRPRTMIDTGQPPEEYWAEKVRWRGIADLVIAGDSRTYKSLSPGEMKKALPGRRIYNFGFSAAAYTDEYLQAVEDVLDPASRAKTILLGVTGSSLTPRAANANGFIEERKPKAEKKQTFLSDDERFAPVRLKNLPSLLFSSSRWSRTFYNEYHPDGWIAAWTVPEMPDEALTVYRDVFHNNRISPEAEERLLRRVAQWRARGIRVLGFRPPISSAMVKLERDLGGFDEREFVPRFERAGGIWIDVPVDRFESYDGSHLRRDAAVRFSRLMADRVSAALGSLASATESK